MNPQQIRELRKRHGWSQERLARELGMSFCTVNRWEQGKASPSPTGLRGLRRLDVEGNISEESRKRLAFRLQTHCPIEVRLKNSEIIGTPDISTALIKATTENMSSIGLMFKTPVLLSKMRRLTIGWRFDKNKHYEVPARVVWTSGEDHEQKVGVKFDHPMPSVISSVLDTLITQ